MKRHATGYMMIACEDFANILDLGKEEKIVKLIEALTICDAEEMGAMLGCKKAHVLYLADTDQIPSMSIANKKLFNRVDVMKALKRRKNKLKYIRKSPKRKPSTGG